MTPAVSSAAPGRETDLNFHWPRIHDGWAAAGAVAGATVAAAARPVTTTTYITTLPCNYTTVAINGATYYQCGTVWYSRGYVNGTVSYVVVPNPVF